MSPRDTQMGGPHRSFPTTVWSDILAAGDPTNPRRREQMDRLLRTYWKPVLAYIQSAWRRDVEDAKDLAQAFFAQLLEKDTISRLTEKGSFRGYLKKALKHFLIDAERADAVRRPPGPVVPVESVALAGPGETPDAAYDRLWFRCVMDAAIDDLRAYLERDGKRIYFDVFRLYCLEGDAESYQDVAAALGLKETDVRNYLTFCRQSLREILRGRIREYVADESEIETELEQILGS
jgi:RNA polymerase sigma factor (sigma-70 family)